MNTKINTLWSKYVAGGQVTTTILTVLFGLIPLFFVPSIFVSNLFAKSVIVAVGTIIAFASFLTILIRSGKIDFVKSPVVWSLGVLSVVYFGISLFSASVWGSFVGYGYESGTFLVIFVGSVLAFLVAVSFNSPKKLFSAQAVFLSVAFLLAVFQAIVVLLGDHIAPVLNWGFVKFLVASLGKTSEIAIFFGLTAVLTLVALELLRLNKLYKTLMYILLGLSLFLVYVINLVVVWYVLVAVIFLFFVYQALFLNATSSRMTVSSMSMTDTGRNSTSPEETRLQSFRKKFSVKTFVVLCITLFFAVGTSFTFGQDVTQKITAKLGIAHFEVRPSWSATYQVLKPTIMSSPIIGSGPNRFSEQWELYRPDINQSNFWNYSFDSGIGFIPTAFVETGIVGIVAWTLFFVALLYVGLRALFVRSSDQLTGYFVISSFVATVFLWTINIVYPSSVGFIGLTFFFTGLFVASAVLGGIGSHQSWSFAGRPRISFIVVSLATAFLVVGLGLGYIVTERVLAAYYFQKGSQLYAAGNTENGEKYILRAAKISSTDTMYRGIAELHIIKIRNLLNAAVGRTEVSEAEKTAFQDSLMKGIEAARIAIEKDPTKYENHVTGARIYETVLPIQVAGAYEAVKTSYANAIRMSPRNPALYLDMARMEVSRNDIAAAESHLKKALELKWNYNEAILFQSQIDLSRGNLPAAIRSIQQTVANDPGDPLGYFRLGLLYYESKNYTRAVEEFQKSISLMPVYANARYFLGLSYARLGRNANAITEFEAVKSTNPDNTEVDGIIRNLREGRDPFASLSAGSGASGAGKLDELPVSEENQQR